MFNLLVFSFLLLFLIGCSEKPPTAPAPPPQVSLTTGNPVRINDPNVELTLLSVLHDTRCSSGGLPCDWPGMATVHILVVQNSDSNLVDLSIGGEFPLDGSRFLWPLDTLGLRLTLLEMNANQTGSFPNALVQIESRTGNSPPSNVIITDLSQAAILVDDFDIDSAWISKDELHLKVVYGGGCRRHLFSLFMSPKTFIDASPREANLYLRHYGAGDLCRALVSEEIVFNLGPVSQNYRFSYGLMEPFQLNLYDPLESGNTEQIVRILFEPKTDALP